MSQGILGDRNNTCKVKGQVIVRENVQFCSRNQVSEETDGNWGHREMESG